MFEQLLDAIDLEAAFHERRAILAKRRYSSRAGEKAGQLMERERYEDTPRHRAMFASGIF